MLLLRKSSQADVVNVRRTFRFVDEIQNRGSDLSRDRRRCLEPRTGVSEEKHERAVTSIVRIASHHASPVTRLLIQQVRAIGRALSGGDHSMPSIDSLLANLANAGAAQKGEQVAQILNEPVHYTDSVSISAYEMAQVTPDAVTHLTNG